MRPSVLVTVTLLLLLAAGAVGCAGPARSAATSANRSDAETLPMRPEWQRFVDENTIGTVMAALNAPFESRFPDLPRATATRNKARGATELLASGQIEVPNSEGVFYRRRYTVVWQQAGGGWRVVYTNVDSPGEVVAPASGGAAARPTSRPAAAPPAPAPE